MNGSFLWKVLNVELHDAASRSVYKVTIRRENRALTRVIVKNKHISKLGRVQYLYVLVRCVCFEHHFIEIILNQEIGCCRKVNRKVAAAVNCWKTRNRKGDFSRLRGTRLYECVRKGLIEDTGNWRIFTISFGRNLAALTTVCSSHLKTEQDNTCTCIYFGVYTWNHDNTQQSTCTGEPLAKHVFNILLYTKSTP